MNAALLYRPHRRWLVWLAFACAAAIHLGAVVLAKGRSDKSVEVPITYTLTGASF